MKKKKFTESQIVKILKEHESGRDAESLSREHGFHKSTLYIWKKKYGGLETSELKRLKELEEENRKLKQMFADLSLDHRILKDIIEKKL
jgi:putative transposase